MSFDSGPVAVLEKQRVLLANDAATEQGVKPGVGTATARALAEGIVLLERDPAAEQRCLQQLCCWAYSISPTLYPYREDSLLLEIGSCLMLYGSVEALLSRIQPALSCRGYRYRHGLAPTPKAAWMLAYISPLEFIPQDTFTEGRTHQRNTDSAAPESIAQGTPAEGRTRQWDIDSAVPEPIPQGTCTEGPTHQRHTDAAGQQGQVRRNGINSGVSGSSLSGTEQEGHTRREQGFSSSGQSLEDMLSPLPLQLLQDFPRQVDALAKAGLWTFGDILALPQQALARRCGKDFVHHLQQILGTAEDRAPDFQPPQQFSDDYWFGYEVKANQELLPAVQLLLQALCRFLRNTQLQTQQVEWVLYDVRHRLRRFEVRSSLAQPSWQEWYQLTRLKVEQLQLDMGIEGVGLNCPQLTPGNATSNDLFQQAGQREPLHSLLDRLKTRLGLQSVRKIACREEHLPEYAGYSSSDTRPATDLAAGEALRPFWLMPEPQLLQQYDGQPCWNGRLRLLDGPERIEDNWWQEPASRDYYVARDAAGQQYWVYRDRLQDRWYMQGVFH